MLTEKRLRELFLPFGLDLTPRQTNQTLDYLHLLLRWNEKINLTAIRDPEEAATRHFAESLFIAGNMRIAGSLLDIGTGAGFPGLALKIVFPDLAVTLLEPVTKKRAFLKEAVRVCGFTDVRILGDRLEDFTSSIPMPQFDFTSMRAVGNLEVLVPLATRCLKPAGNLLLWLSQEQGAGLNNINSGLTWLDPLPIPLSRTTEIWRGLKRA